MAGVLNDGVGVVLDGASEVVLVSNFHRFVDCRSQPRHGFDFGCDVIDLSKGF